MRAPFDGWRQVLTVPLPVADAAPFVLLPVVVTGVAAAAVGVAPARSLVRPVASIIAWATALTLGIGGPGSALAVTAPLALAVSLWLFRRTEVRASVRSSAVGVVGTVGALAVATLLAAPASTLLRDEPFDPRQQISPPVEAAPLNDPLDRLGSQLRSDSPEPVMVLRTEEPVDAGLIQVVNYERYDGVRWRLNTAAVPVREIQSVNSAPNARTIRQTVETTAATKPWIPRIGEVTRVQGQGIIGVGATGTLVDTRRTTGPFTLDATLPDTDTDTVSAGRVDESPFLLDPACLPAEFVDGFALATSVGSAAEQVASARQWLLTDSGVQYSLDEKVDPGQSCARLQALVSTSRDRRATSEQLATLLALGLRSQNFPARVAYGYRITGPAADGSFQPLAKDAAAFVQVKLDPVGWISITAQPDDPQNPSAPVSDLEELNQTVKQIQSQGGPTVDPNAPGDADEVLEEGGLNRAVIAGLVGVLIVAVVLGWWVLAWSLRRRRRIAAQAQAEIRKQVLSAYGLARDAAASFGSHEQAHQWTCPEFAAADLGPDLARDQRILAALAEEALYAQAAMSMAQASEAFRCSDKIVGELRSRSSRRTRFAREFSLAR